MTEKGRFMSTMTPTGVAGNQANGSAHPDAEKAVSLRLATPEDAQSLRVLAELDEEPALAGQILVAMIDDEAAAAMSISDGRIVANPFVATSDAVALLRLRARHLAGKRSRRRRRPLLRPRFA
jgi:hypothetical protein